MSLYLQLGRFSLLIFSFLERLFNWHKRFFWFGLMPALPKLILFGFIFLLQNGKIFLIQVLQYQVSSLLLSVCHVLKFECKKWNLAYKKKESNGLNILISNIL